MNDNENVLSGDGITFTDEMYVRLEKDEYTRETDFNEASGIALSVGRIMFHFGNFMKFDSMEDSLKAFKKANAQSIVCERRINAFKEKLVSIIDT